MSERELQAIHDAMLGHHGPSKLPKSRTDLRERYAEVLENLHYAQLRKFAYHMIRDLAWEGGEGGDVVQEEAEKWGLIVRVEGGYDPKKHGPNIDAEPGCPWYELSDWMKGSQRE